MNRISNKINEDKKVLSIYFTAGYPKLDDTAGIIRELAANGVDMIEIGLPFSDPLADGPVIQESSTQALKNGMHTALLFDQLKGIRKDVSIPLIIMGYFNPVYQYGVEPFCKQCSEIGIDAVILPDLPPDVFKREYKKIFDKHGLKMCFLITPQTSEARILEIDTLSEGFIYMVSTASTTGKTSGFDDQSLGYFKRVAAMDLKNPLIVGFGIHDATTFGLATEHTRGAIIGSAFIRHLTNSGVKGIKDFIKRFR